MLIGLVIALAVGWLIGGLVLRAVRGATHTGRCPHCQGKLPNTRQLPATCLHCHKDIVWPVQLRG